MAFSIDYQLLTAAIDWEISMYMQVKEDLNNVDINQQYDDYLFQHITNVQKGYDWIKENLPEVLKKASMLLSINILQHDRSKTSVDEYRPYAEYFYGRKSKEVEKAFNYAWNSHIHLNGHHWQHWMLQHDDEGLELLEIPYDYIIEMICDWWAFSWKSNNLYEVFDWYDKHKKGIQMNDISRKTLEDILDKIKNKLDKDKLNDTK